MEPRKILIVGSSNLDSVIHVRQIPVVGETVLGDGYEKHFGGKGANQACACGRLGGRAEFLTGVGADGDAARMLESLQDAGVDVSRVLRTPEQPTGMAIIYVNDDGDNSIVVVPGANGLCTPGYLDGCGDALESADILLMQMEIPLETVAHLLEKTRGRGKTVILNPAPVPDRFPEELYPLADYLTPNETELSGLSGLAVTDLSSAARAASRLLEKGARNVLVTLGAEGSLLVNGGGARHFPAFPVRAADTTAAGDTFNAGIAVALAEGRGIEEAVRFATAASAISVSRVGAQESIPARAEVEQFLAAHPAG